MTTLTVNVAFDEPSIETEPVASPANVIVLDDCHDDAVDTLLSVNAIVLVPPAVESFRTPALFQKSPTAGVVGSAVPAVNVKPDAEDVAAAVMIFPVKVPPERCSAVFARSYADFTLAGVAAVVVDVEDTESTS